MSTVAGMNLSVETPELAHSSWSDLFLQPRHSLGSRALCLPKPLHGHTLVPLAACLIYVITLLMIYGGSCE